jgi:hypothetical protein
MTPLYTLTQVTFDCSGDGITALYINGEWFTQGDYYHDKISDYIAGLVGGLEFARGEGWCAKVEMESIDIEQSVEEGEVPKTLEEVKRMQSI